MGKVESEIQSAIMNMLLINYKVAWAHVTTTGKLQGRGGHWLTVGFPGLADIIGQTTSGKLFAMEVKKPGEKATKEQQDFINVVLKNNGIAGIVESVEDAQELLK